MIGNQSFNIVENEDRVIGSYYPEVMRSWQAIVGFSGTVNYSTL